MPPTKRKSKEVPKGSSARKRSRDRQYVEEENNEPQAPQQNPEDMEIGEAEIEDEEDNEIEMEEGGIRIGDIYIPPPPRPACTMEAKGPRLMITSIENINFKSYAGKQVLGPFHKSFTSIIGPNGSGKSNVIDSMLFVFGYRAQKIRSKKISVLIHNSDKHPNLQSCSVAVHFQMIEDLPGDDYTVVSNSQFVIARTAFKDNSSYYQLNGRRVQFKEVAKVLRSHGIDLDHNRFLILQGEVEQIAMMKPKAPNEHESGMLEYLEDIIGSSRYKEPIEQLNKNVETLNEQRVEKLNRVKLVEKEKDELEGPKNEAMAYIQLENKITENQNILCQAYIYAAKKNIQDAEDRKKEVEEEMGDLKAELEKHTKDKTEGEAKLRKCVEELEATRVRHEVCVEKHNKIEKEDHKLGEDAQILNNNRKKAMTALENEQKKLEDLIALPEKNTKKIEELRPVLEKFESQRATDEAELNEIMKNLKIQTQGLQAEKETHELKLIDLKKAVNETQSALNIAQSELDIYLSNEKKEKDILESMKNNLTSNMERLEQLHTSLRDLEKNLPHWSKTSTEAESKLKTTNEEEEKLNTEIRNLRMRLEETRSALTANRSRGRLLDSLMEQKRNGNLPGIFGRLGDLGAVDEKYDVAVSTACGPLDNIVVDTVTTAQKCIEYLKRNNLGVATFIALEKQERLKEYAQRKQKYPENVSRLYDLIRVKDERVKPAFYYGLRETLVVDTLEQATRIAFGATRYRVVTLKGELIEPSGTMSGGGRALRGRIGRSVATDTSASEVSAKDIEETEQQLKVFVERCAGLRQAKTQLEETIVVRTKEIREAETNKKKWAMEIKALEDQMEGLKAQVANQEVKVKQATPDKAQVKKLEAEIAKKKKSYDSAVQSASEIEAEVQEVHAKIMELTEGQMKKAQAKLDETNQQIAKINSEMTKLSVAIKTSKRNETKCREKIASLNQEIEEAVAELKNMQTRRQKLEDEAVANAEEKQILAKEMSKLKNEIAELKTALEVITKDENKARCAKIEFDQKMEKLDKIIELETNRIHLWTQKRSKLSLQSVGNEEAPELATLSDEELETVDTEKLKRIIEVDENQLQSKSPNLQAIADYRKKEEVYLARVAELEEITKTRDEYRKHVDDLRKAREKEFMAGFNIITGKLKEMYQMITLGGDAELELVDTLNPFSEGIVFSVRPPKKSWKNISNLSGGEKTLSSLALVFALHYYKPTPLYVMDEIDAALDFKNVSIVGNYIKERTRNAQFIIISLRSNMFELADRLVGIYKTENCTKSLTVNPSRYSTPAIETRN